MAVSKEDGDKLESFYSKLENKEELKYPVMVTKDTGVIIFQRDTHTYRQCHEHHCRLILKT